MPAVPSSPSPAAVALSGEVVLGAALSEYVAELDRCLGILARAEPTDGERAEDDDHGAVHDAVHDARVSCRRLRGLLSAYRPLVRRRTTDPIRVEIAWLARSLGSARDSHVALTRIHGLVQEHSGPGDDGTRARLERAARERSRAAVQEARAAVHTDRSQTVLRTLVELAAAPPWTPVSRSPADSVMAPLARSEWQRLVVLADARQDADPEHLHEVRKAAKRARYTAEALAPARLPDVDWIAVHAKAVSQLLGEHQDTVVTRTELHELAAADPDGARLYDELRGREEARADELTRQFEELWRRLAAGPPGA